MLWLCLTGWALSSLWYTNNSVRFIHAFCSRHIKGNLICMNCLCMFVPVLALHLLDPNTRSTSLQRSKLCRRCESMHERLWIFDGASDEECRDMFSVISKKYWHFIIDSSWLFFWTIPQQVQLHHVFLCFFAMMLCVRLSALNLPGNTIYGARMLPITLGLSDQLD